MKLQGGNHNAWRLSLIGAAILFMYSAVLWKLGYDWWTDDNYSHGLLVPFLIVFIVWQRFDVLKRSVSDSRSWAGLILIAGAAIMLLVGTLASVLYAQRLSLLVMLAGVTVSLFGLGMARQLTMPFLLLFLAVPVPQILFNKVAFPLQMLASRIAEAGIRLMSIPVSRMGNVIDIPYRATGDVISLEVVEACSGIRSLVTLIALALMLGYFTRERRDAFSGGFRSLAKERDVQLTLLLTALSVPVALVTNAARVVVTGVIAHVYGQEAVEGLWHELAGSAVFLAALLLLLGLNFLIRRILGDRRADAPDANPPVESTEPTPESRVSLRKVFSIFLVVVLCGGFVNWFQYRGEVQVERRPLSELPARLGDWEQRNEDIRFDEESEKVLRATDYVMRDYYGPGKRLNVYVGYYASQRGGSTYHSPLNCLPGGGWEMSEPQVIRIRTPSGRVFDANRYIVSLGEHKEYLIYWYQGRGRTFTSEFKDKLYTSIDSVLERRSDGGMVRVMTPIGKDPGRSLAAAVDLTGHLADNISQFLPD